MTTEAGSDLKLAGATVTGDFEPEQKRYLEGFAAGLQIAKTAKGLAGSAAGLAGALAAPAPEPVGPDAAALKAQDRVSRPAANCRTRRSSSASSIRSTPTSG